jgi:hypothetical protein
LQKPVHDVATAYAGDAITRNQLIQDEAAAAAAGDDGGDGEGAIRWIWDCPTTGTMHGHGWYIHVQDDEEDDEQEGENESQGSTDGTRTMPPEFICQSANVLHVHNSLSITAGIPLLRCARGCDLSSLPSEKRSLLGGGPG